MEHLTIKKFLLIALLAFCTTTPVLAESTDADPWEKWNRKIDAFNQFGDRWVVKPVAVAYDWVTPDIVDRGITNMYSNVREPITIINDLLQFKFDQAGNDTSRLLINSTVGLLGFFDVASKAGFELHNEDFGQTLGHWGVPSGPYVVLPLLGPSTLRDGLGMVPDAFTNPLAYVEPNLDQTLLMGGYYVDLRADILGVEELVSGDAYSFVKEAYFQSREFDINDGVVEDDFGEEDF